MKNPVLILFFLLLTISLQAQLGGSSTFKSMTLSTSPRITSLGGKAFGIYDGDINLAVDNPSLIQKDIHQQLSFSNNFYFAGINYGTFAYAHSIERAGTLAAAIKYVSYGQMEGRDASGALTGDFRAGDYVMSLGYGNVFRERWLYGATFKLVYSHLETYSAVGLALDLAGSYHNPEKDITLTAIIRNAGVQLKSYTEEGKEPLPYEVSLGLSKKFKSAPIRLNIIVHNLQKPDLSYDSPDVVTSVNIFGEPESSATGIVDKIFMHFIFGAEVDIKKPVSIRIGYNHQVRKETALPGKKGLAGITVGTGIHIRQFSIDYGFASYHPSANIHHVGLTVNLNQFPGRSPKGTDEEN